MLYSLKKHNQQQGFTLLEIVVVLAIIGTVTVLLGMRLNHDADRVARLEVKRFITILREIRDESVLTGKPIAMHVDEGALSYEFMLYRDESWQSPEKQDGLYKTRSVQQNVEIQFDVYEAAENTEGSLLLVTPLGEITPFRMTFFGNKYRYDVELDEQQNLQSFEVEIDE